MANAAFKKSASGSRRVAVARKYSFLRPRPLNFPAEQQASPGETGAETCQEHEVYRHKPFTFMRLGEADGNCARRGVGVLIYIDGDLGLLQLHPFHGCANNAKVGLMGDVQLKVLPVQFVPVQHFLRYIRHTANGELEDILSILMDVMHSLLDGIRG